MDDEAISAVLIRLERAVSQLEGATEAVADRLALQAPATSDRHLRSEVDAVIEELSAMIGDRRG